MSEFATFNEKAKHINVEIGGGWTTVSVKTPSGKRVTFAFVPYESEGDPQCVDVQYQGKPEGADEEFPKQKVILFGKGPTYYHWKLDSAKEDKVTVTTVLMEDE